LRDASLRKAVAVVVIGARMRDHLEARGVSPRVNGGDKLCQMAA
jgi:hypothetical protein